MRDLLKRLEQLERATAPAASVFLIGWQGQARTAKHGGEVIEREAGETLEAFWHRVAEYFGSVDRMAYVWMA